MLQELQNIKEQLFDAPVEIKESFNKLVSYFDNEMDHKSPWYIVKFTPDSKTGKGPHYNLVSKLRLDYWKKMGVKCTVVKGPFNSEDEGNKELKELKSN